MGKMTKVLVVAAAVAMTGCCASEKFKARIKGEVPQYQCREFGRLHCEKMQECFPEEFVLTFGAGDDAITACTTIFALSIYDNGTDPCAEENPCANGEVWDVEEADECLRGVATMSCSKMEDEIYPKACDRMCGE